MWKDREQSACGDLSPETRLEALHEYLLSVGDDADTVNSSYLLRLSLTKFTN